MTAQLLYEIGGPDYLNPDVVARLDTVTLEQSGYRPVSVSGVLGKPPTPTTKVAMTGLGAWRNSVSVVLTGLDLEAKASRRETAVRAGLEDEPGIDDCDSPGSARPSTTPPSRWRVRACCRLRSTARSRVVAERSLRSWSSSRWRIIRASTTQNRPGTVRRSGLTGRLRSSCMPSIMLSCTPTDTPRRSHRRSTPSCFHRVSADAMWRTHGVGRLGISCEWLHGTRPLGDSSLNARSGRQGWKRERRSLGR